MSEHGPEMPRRRRRLKNLKLNRVDLVSAGANPGALVLIAKEEEDIEKRITERDGKFCVQSKDGSRDFGCFDSRGAAERRLAQVEHFSKREVSPEERERLAGRGAAMPDGSFPIASVQDLKNAISSIGRAKNRAATIAHIKRRARALGATDLLPDTFKSVILEDDMDQVETVEVPEAPIKEVVETVNEEIVMVETVAKSDFEKEVELRKELEAEVNKMKHEKREAEFIAKAKDELANFGRPEEVGKLMLAASDHFTPEQYKALERLMKAANAQLEAGDLFAQFSEPNAESASVEDRITSLAKAKVEAGLAKTIEIAKLQVLNENPDIRAEIRSK